jgi:hypothetical protein
MKRGKISTACFKTKGVAYNIWKRHRVNVMITDNTAASPRQEKSRRECGEGLA